jgi:hypothetical protein
MRWVRYTDLELIRAGVLKVKQRGDHAFSSKPSPVSSAGLPEFAEYLTYYTSLDA